MSIDNKPNAEEVLKDKPEAKEVVSKGPINPEEIISDILRAEPAKDSESPSPKVEDKKEAVADEKKPEVSPEKKEELKVFAKVGNREFKSQDELTKFVTQMEKDLSSQKGFNSWITGAVKKMRPELFNADGSIKSADLQKIVEGASAKAGAAADVLKEHAGKSADELTEEQKEDIKKAREILKPLGVVFADDPKFKKMEEDLTRYRERDLESAMSVIDEFATKHPAFNDHRVAIGELMEQRGYTDLNKAWKVFKAEQDIVEEEVKTEEKKDDDAGKNKSVDTTIPTAVKKESGSLPTSGKKDIWDDVLSLR